ncbi:N-glycosylase/DNA lyase [Strongyloides ratti]|uniref:DNA-(apurinic or apyrimidinic site) lyase n=1 Tax=Strongyloides ratti TaxID=34506 RepID=A0A090LC64_STRRB|nr:N-glycosylase/DNA lyase [Strongyloides ratti]CEF65683.1 N-glycosylase/DNA lyase [Strongyloides ratti]
MPVINIPKNVLNLEIVLFNGQSFRWRSRKTLISTEYYGVAYNRVWKIEQLNDKTLKYEILHSFTKTNEDKDHAIFNHYFNLDVNVTSLSKEWINDKYFKKVINEHPNLLGIRILNQEVFETIISFICSSNNNVPRISKMVEKFCQLYGECFEYDNMKFYSLPNVEKLQNISNLNEVLRKHSFGYRAKYIADTILMINKLGGSKFLETLQTKSTEEARTQLLKFCGVGRKVADCILLMGLRHYHVVPCDVHVKRLVKKNYLSSLDEKKFKDKDVHDVQEFFELKFGKYAGWVQSILFTVQLLSLKI